MSDTRAGTVDIMGVHFDAIDITRAVSEVERLMSTQGLSRVVTANLDYIAQIQRDSELGRRVSSAELVVADGVPILWMARWSGQYLPGRVNGTDLVFRLLRVAGKRGWPVAYLGGDPGVAQGAARVANQRWSTPVGGVWPLTPDEVADDLRSSEIASEVGALGDPLVLVGLGAGRQDDWIARQSHLLGGGVAIGVGSALDFVAGTRRRAPRALQRTGLEWLWRLGLEPRRLWQRYLIEDFGLLARFAARSLEARLRHA